MPVWISLSWSPDGSMLAGVGRQVAVFSENLQLRTAQTIDGAGAYYSAVWKPDLSQIAVLTDNFRKVYTCNATEPCIDQTVIIWDADLQRVETTLRSYRIEGYLDEPVFWNADGSLLVVRERATDGEQFNVWDTQTWQLRLQMPSPLESAGQSSGAVAHQHFRFAITNLEWIKESGINEQVTKSVSVIDLFRGAIQQTLDLPVDVRELAYTPHWSTDELQLYVYTRSHIFTYDVESASLVSSTAWDFEFMSNVSEGKWSPDDRWIITQNWQDRDSNFLSIWDSVTGRRVQTITMPPPNDGFGSVAWTPDGKQLAVSTFAGEIQLYDVSGLPDEAPMLIATNQEFVGQY